MSSVQQGSIVLPTYQTGAYYATHTEPGCDDRFKADAFLRLLNTIARRHHPLIDTYADVGCGSGGVAQFIFSGLQDSLYPVTHADGFDISPHVHTLRQPNVRFHMADFCAADVHYSLTTLFDVIEHVPNPVGFLSDMAERSDFIALHIPLDRTLTNCFFDRFHHRLAYPGHLTLLDAPAAINLVTAAGVTPIDYLYTHGYGAPSGTLTWKQKAAYPVRAALAQLSPWLAQKTVGGVSLMVFGATRTGLKKMRF